MSQKRKQFTHELTVRYVPLPPHKRAAFEHAFDLLADLLLDELEQEQQAAERNTSPKLQIGQTTNAVIPI